MLHYNPALVGTQSDFAVGLNYRNQWPGIEGNPITSSLVLNYNLKNGIGFGFSSMRDKIGFLIDDAIKSNINYTKTFKQVEFKIGVNVGLIQRHLDLSRARFRDPMDPVLDHLDSKKNIALDVGTAGYYKGFMFGVAVHQFNKPNISLFGGTSKLGERYVVNLGYHKELKHITLGGLGTFQHQYKTSTLDYQLLSQYRFVKLGLGYRQVFGQLSNSDWFMASVGLQFDKFSLNYTYEDDPFENRSSIVIQGTHEATIAWYIKGLRKENGLSKLMQTIL